MKIFIHGILVSEPENSVGKLKKYTKSGLLFNYGKIGVLGALFKNRSIARDLADSIEGMSGVTIYAHSNGCAIAVLAAREYGAQIENLICIAPALNRDLVFPGSIKNILVLSSKKDMATKFARIFDSLPIIGWFIPDLWGSMGTDNYIGTDSRVTKKYQGTTIAGHSDYFTEEDTEEVYRVTEEWLASL